MAGSATDRLENELLSELENARLVRLLCKFGFINERPEYVLFTLSPFVDTVDFFFCFLKICVRPAVVRDG